MNRIFICYGHKCLGNLYIIAVHSLNISRCFFFSALAENVYLYLTSCCFFSLLFSQFIVINQRCENECHCARQFNAVQIMNTNCMMINTRHTLAYCYNSMKFCIYTCVYRRQKKKYYIHEYNQKSENEACERRPINWKTNQTFVHRNVLILHGGI